MQMNFQMYPLQEQFNRVTSMTRLAFNILMATGTKLLLLRDVLHFIQRYLI